jgi:hypothetical protein
MGYEKNVGYEKFPSQGEYLGERVNVCFSYVTDKFIEGTIIRDDIVEPYQTIIKLDDGRYILATECQYSLQ